MTDFTVDIGRGAQADLTAIIAYLAPLRGTGEALALVAALLEKIETLSHFPLRGGVPPDLDDTGETTFRELLFGRYRIIYEVEGRRVTIVLVADGRRDMAALLRDRLLGQASRG